MVGIWQCVKTNSTPVVHMKIAGKWMFIPLKMVLIGIDPYPSVGMGYSFKETQPSEVLCLFISIELRIAIYLGVVGRV